LIAKRKNRNEKLNLKLRLNKGIKNSINDDKDAKITNNKYSEINALEVFIETRGIRKPTPKEIVCNAHHIDESDYTL